MVERRDIVRLLATFDAARGDMTLDMAVGLLEVMVLRRLGKQ